MTAFLALAALATVSEQKVDYTVGGVVFEGTVIRDDAPRVNRRRPVVIVFHDWDGPNAHEMRVGRRLAELGYVAFVGDLYGKNNQPKTQKENGEFAGRVRGDNAMFRSRLLATYKAAGKVKDVNPGKIAAIGYCFGGGAVLELSRTGANVVGNVSFHGSLSGGPEAELRKIKGETLILHGAADPFVPPAAVNAFKESMVAAKKNYLFAEYPGAVHAFAVEEAGNDPSLGAAYDANADAASWNSCRAFLNRVFFR